jgi:osmotically-inducible protein OsmY
MIGKMIIGVVGIALLALTICFEPLAFAQSDTSSTSNGNSSSASSSMHRAGESTENAVSSAYQGTKRAVEDTTVTSRVKLALHEDKVTHGTDIHVDTIGGVVTLSGSAPSTEAAHRAIDLAKHTKGVQAVKNAISVGPQKNSMR